jgi:tripartite-type tricarboxylate transporter receptor subunit TctC
MQDVRTLSESGLPGFDVTGWYGVLVPAGTPTNIVAKMQADIATVLQTAEVASKLSSEGAEPVAGTPEQFAQFLRSETQKWAKVVKAAGIKLD